MSERRNETRKRSEVKVCVWGIDGEGSFFRKTLVASNISGSGALLSDLGVRLRCDDVVFVRYENIQARFRVIWVRDDRAAVQRQSEEPCPWEALLAKKLGAGA
jgi:hypothetical protein